MENLQKQINKNLEYTKEIHGMVKKIRRYVIFQQVFSVIKIVLIVIPLIIGIIFALPFFKEALNTYQGVMGSLSKSQAPDTNNIFEMINQIQGSSNINKAEIEEFLK